MLAIPDSLVALRDSQGIPIYSPNGATASREPLVFWKGEPGRRYDLLITDEYNPATPPWSLSKAEPPIDFGLVEQWKNRPLAEDGLYRLRVTESGNRLNVGEYTFRTLKAAGSSVQPTPAARLAEAFALLASNSARVGDALANLLTLPPELADSELALRLKALAFARLGFRSDFEAMMSAVSSGRGLP